MVRSEHAPSPDKRADQRRPRVWPWVLGALWLSSVASGLWGVWAYENSAGANANAPRRWPAQSTLVPASDRPTLLFIVHPQCTCTRASVEELAEVLARAPIHPKTYVLFLRPSVFDTGWVKTDLWRSTAMLPNVTLLRDDDGLEARRFGVETSGQTLLYDSRGTLIFSGGITGSRGHAGDNAGETALVGLLTRGQADRSGTGVFGCPLFAGR
jgi:hypothetical protein